MRGDPYAMTAKFPGECQGRKPDGSKCGAPIKRGDRIFYYPNGRTAFLMGKPCGCGEQRQRQFECERADESGW